MVLDYCQRCGKMLWNWRKMENCKPCAQKIKQEQEEQRRKEQQRRHEEAIRKGKRRKKRAREQLKQKLKKEREQRKKQRKKIKKQETVVEKTKQEPPKKPKQQRTAKRKYIFTPKEKRDYHKLLYVEADVKHIKVVEWVNGKKRVALNKERELRRTKAGGYSAEKFQKFVEMQKERTEEWMTKLLKRPGVLKPPYHLIRVQLDEDTEGIQDFLTKQGPVENI